MAAAARKLNWFAIWTSVVVVLVLVAIAVVVVVMNRAATETAPPGEAPTSAVVDKTTGAIAIGEGENTLELYADFMCPHCQEFEQVYGSVIDDLVDQGRITLNLHPVALPSLDNASGTHFSTRAANATYCIAVGSPEATRSFVNALFATNPTPPGQTDDELLKLAEDAGASDISQCVADQTYASFVTERTKELPPNPETGQAGTPTVILNGRYLTLTGDPQADIVDALT